MGMRHYKRLRATIPVKVYGTDFNGNPFMQSAATVDISPGGICLRGVECLVPDTVVQVENKKRRARFRVVWIGRRGTSTEGCAGLQDLQGAQLLFPEHMPSSACAGMQMAHDSYCSPSEFAATCPLPAAPPSVGRGQRTGERRQQERRRHPRFFCAGTARFWQDNCEHPISARLNEISLGGCYIEIMSPLPIGSSLRLELTVLGKLLRLGAIVRSLQPNFGMGLEFAHVPEPELRKLSCIIGELSGGLLPSLEEKSVGNNESSQSTGLGLAGQVMRWFETHSSLSRQEFLDLANPNRKITTAPAAETEQERV